MGHGGASVDHDYAVIHRLRVPVAASMVKVSGRLRDPSGAAPPASVVAEVSALIAPGMDGETLRNTRWVAQQGASGTISDGPERVMRVEGYNAGADTWVMVFDGPGEPGGFPAMARPVRAGRLAGRTTTPSPASGLPRRCASEQSACRLQSRADRPPGGAPPNLSRAGESRTSVR